MTAIAAPTTVKNLGKWLRENVYREKGEGGRFSLVVVCQILAGNKRGEEVFSIDVPKKAKDTWTEETALDIYTRLQAEAAVLRGFQKWMIYAYFSDDAENHAARFPVAIDGGTEEDETGNPMDSEGSGTNGQIRQLQRHLEAAMKVNTAMQMTSHSALNNLVTKLSNIAESALDKRVETLEMVEDMVRQKHAQEIEMLTAGTKAEAIRDIGKRLGLFIPAVANRIAGKDLFPVEANAVMMMTKGLFTAIAADEKRLEQLMGMLKPEERVAFMNLYETISKSVGDDGMPADGGKNGAASPKGHGAQ